MTPHERYNALLHTAAKAEGTTPKALVKRLVDCAASGNPPASGPTRELYDFMFASGSPLSVRTLGVAHHEP